MDSVFFVLEFIGTIAFAVSGAMLAIKSKMDVFGVCALGVTTAVGGGIIRDILLGVTPPTCFTEPVFLLLAIGTALLTFTIFYHNPFAHKRKITDVIMLIADSVGLGVFTVIGVKACFYTTQNPQLFLALCSGVITGVGGGVMRDVMAKNTPFIFVKHFYACSSIIGALFSYVIWVLINELVAMILGVIIVVILRILAARFHWKLPKVHLKNVK